MRNVLGIILTVLIIAAMEVPAMATLDMGGMVFFDTYYYQQDKAGFSNPLGNSLRTTPGSGGVGGIPVGTDVAGSDRHQVYFDLNHATSLWFKWTSENGAGIFVTPYMNADPIQFQAGNPGFQVGVANVIGWYDFTRDFRMTVGKGGFDQVFSPLDPETWMGYDGVAKVLGLGYGNINSLYENGIRFTYTFLDVPHEKFKADIYIAEARLTSGAPDGYPVFLSTMNPELKSIAGTVADNNTLLPKIEVDFPLTFKYTGGSVTLYPSGMYLKQTFDNIAPGADDSIVSYGLSLGVKAQIGHWKLEGEYNYGQNMGNASRPGTAQYYPFKFEYAVTIGTIGYARADDNGHIYNSITNAFWLQASYQVWRLEPRVIYGWQQSIKNQPGFADQATTQMYGVNCPIIINKNFIIKPEVMIYDDGSDNELRGVHYYFGKELLAGVEFIYMF